MSGERYDLPPDGWTLASFGVHVSDFSRGWVAGRDPEPADTSTTQIRGFVHASAPGLAVTQATGSSRGKWRVTHVESGYAAGHPMESAAVAAEFAVVLAGLADWTCDTAAAIALCTSDEIRARARAFFASLAADPGVSQ